MPDVRSLIYYDRWRAKNRLRTEYSLGDGERSNPNILLNQTSAVALAPSAWCKASYENIGLQGAEYSPEA